MKILVIDRDQLASQMISKRLEAEGHTLHAESVKSDGLDIVAKEDFDVIMIDPSPMVDAKAMALNIRRSARTYPYVILMTQEEEIDIEGAMQMGCNDFIMKPLDMAEIVKKVSNAQRLKSLFDNLSDTSEDFVSAGGVIAKSAFNQLCLSAMERGGRYNELAFILSIRIDDYKEIKKLDGAFVADFSVSKMAQHMVRLRRLSDIIGQTGVNEYSILLQRTENLTEGLDAAKRFAATFDELNDLVPPEGKEINISIDLTHLPTGAMPFEHKLTKSNT